MHNLLSILSTFQSYAKANPVMAGLVGIWTATTISFIFIRFPLRIWRFLEGQFTTSLAINNSTYGYNLENFNSFLIWFNSNRWTRFSRSFSFDPSWGETTTNMTDSNMVLGAGEGKHFFVFNGRLFWLVRERLQTSAGSQTNMLSYQIRIYMFGRSQKKLMELIDTFRYRIPRNMVGIYRVSKGGDWHRVKDVQKRALNTVFVDEEIAKLVLEDILWFNANRQWFVDRGIPYKLTFLLYGPPGSGKSSFIKAITSHFARNLCLINLGDMSDSSLESAFANAPSNSIVAIEDFDTAAATRARKGLSVKDKLERERDSDNDSGLIVASPASSGDSDIADKPTTDDGLASLFGALTLTGFLNALDGLIPLDGSIIFLTSNKIDGLDEAVIRDGRVDRKIYMGELTDPLIRNFFLMLYPDFPKDTLENFQSGKLHPVMGATLYGLFGKNKHNPQGFLDELQLLP